MDSQPSAPSAEGIEKFSYLDTREVGKRLYRILADFYYNDKHHGTITVPAGFVTNYASIDALRNLALFPVYALLAGYGDKAAVIHDYMYSGSLVIIAQGEAFHPTRKEADEVYYRALRDEGIAKWRAKLFYSGVRLFGAKYFRGKQ